MKNLEIEKKRGKIASEIASILNVKELSPKMYNEPDNLVRKMADVVRLGNLIQDYMTYDYNYLNPMLGFEIVANVDGAVHQPCYALATNRVWMDVELIKRYSMEDIFFTLLHELRHKQQYDAKGYKPDIPRYSRYMVENESDYDMLWDMEKDELDADIFAYYYSKKILSGQTKKREHGKLYKFKYINPIRGGFNFLKGNLRFNFVKHRLKDNPDMTYAEIPNCMREYFLSDKAYIRVQTEEDYSYIDLSMLELAAIAENAETLDSLTAAYAEVKKSKPKYLYDKLISIDYNNPPYAPIEEESLILGLYDSDEEIKRCGVGLSMWNLYLRYLMQDLDSSPEKITINEYAIYKLNEGLDNGLHIEDMENLFELNSDIFEARKVVVRNKLEFLESNKHEQEENE